MWACLTYNSWLKVNKDGPWHVLPRPRLAEERIKRVVHHSYSFVAWHLSIGLDSVFEAVQFPTRVAHLAPGLSHVDWNTFTLKVKLLFVDLLTLVRNVHTWNLRMSSNTIALAYFIFHIVIRQKYLNGLKYDVHIGLFCHALMPGIFVALSDYIKLKTVTIKKKIY